MENQIMESPQMPPVSPLPPLAAKASWVLPAVIVGVLVLGGGAFGYYKYGKPSTPEHAFVESRVQIAKASTFEFEGDIAVHGFEAPTDGSSAHFSGAIDARGSDILSQVLVALNFTPDATSPRQTITLENRNFKTFSYLKIGGEYLRTLLPPSMSVYLDRWIQFRRDEALEKSSSPTLDTKKLSQIKPEQIEKLKKDFDQAHMIRVTLDEKGEVMEGEATRHIAFALDEEGTVTFLKVAAKDIGQEWTADNEQNLRDMFKETSITGELWTGVKTKRPLKLILTASVHPATGDPGTVTLSVVFKNYNKDVHIEEPIDFVNFEEVLRAAFGGSTVTQESPSPLPHATATPRITPRATSPSPTAAVKTWHQVADLYLSSGGSDETRSFTVAHRPFRVRWSVSLTSGASAAGQNDHLGFYVERYPKQNEYVGCSVDYNDSQIVAGKTSGTLSCNNGGSLYILRSGTHASDWTNWHLIVEEYY